LNSDAYLSVAHFYRLRSNLLRQHGTAMEHAIERRRPTQHRARKTKLLIFETATRLLEQHGLEGFNTNRLADMSGVSVGTIYQYFADKRAIVLALALHEQEGAIREIREALMADIVGVLADEELPRVRALVRAIVHTFGGRQRAHRVLTDLSLQTEAEQPIEQPMSSFSTLLTTEAMRGSQGASIALSEIDAFVLTRAVIGSIRAALLCDARLLRRPQYEDALTGLITGFLRARAL
jgi:AcrR family transcriptional regulator